MLLQRIITAVLLAPLALAGFFLLDGGWFALFIGAVISLAGWEWARMAGFEKQPARVTFALLVAALLAGLYELSPDVPWLAPLVLWVALLWWLIAFVLVVKYPGSGRAWRLPGVSLLIGLLILLPAWQGLMVLKQWSYGNWLISAVMILVWAADVGAYFAGKAFGKRKLAPKVSPGKSWEGFVGGMLLSLFLVALLGLYLEWAPDLVLHAVLAAAVVVAFSVLGDLTESMFKRQSGIKDSSNLLPGHGGVFDRIDSLTAAIPVFALLLWQSGRFVS